MRRRVGILVSGRGNTMMALIEAAQATDYPAEIALVLSDIADAPALTRAIAVSVPAETVSRANFITRRAFEAALTARLDAAGVELICLAGFMRVLSAGFVAAWRGRIINIHPSLLPAFRGLDPHAQALAAGVTISGATVHHVTAAIDEGQPIAQAAVPVVPSDTPKTLAARVLAAEVMLYPHALRLLLLGEPLQHNGDEMLISPPRLTDVVKHS